MINDFLFKNHPWNVLKEAITSYKPKNLTPKLADVLKLIASGHNNKEIADLLKISTKAVEHRRDILKQMYNITGHGSSALSDLTRIALKLFPDIRDTQITKWNKEKNNLHLLTPQELSILKLMVRGYGINDISKFIKLSPKTIEVYHTSILKKLNIYSASDLTTFAMNNGLVGIDYIKGT